MRRLKVLLALAVALGLAGAGAALAQDRARTKEIVIGLGAEPRTMLAVTIVDWTTNTQLEHIYDRLLDRDARPLKPKPLLAAVWRDSIVPFTDSALKGSPLWNPTPPRSGNPHPARLTLRQPAASLGLGL